MSLAGRIKLAMSAAGLRGPADLARRMKVPRQTVHKWLQGEREEIRPTLLYALADALNVNARWLALGPPALPSRGVHLSPDDQELLDIAGALDAQAREQWVSTGRTLMRLSKRASPNNPFPNAILKRR